MYSIILKSNLKNSPIKTLKGDPFGNTMMGPTALVLDSVVTDYACLFAIVVAI